MTGLITPVLRFEATGHRYFLAERELLSVTTVLKEAGLVDDRFYTDEAAARGQYIHQALHLLDEGRLSEPAVDPVLAPYIAAYQSFTALVAPVWRFMEHRVHDAVVGYAGCLDRAGTFTLNGTKCVLDVKTGAVPPWVGLQLAAYRRCLPEPHTWRRVALQLKADGSFALHECTDRQDERTFLAALLVAQWKRGSR